jgi:hypothetical protein
MRTQLARDLTVRTDVREETTITTVVTTETAIVVLEEITGRAISNVNAEES